MAVRKVGRRSSFKSIFVDTPSYFSTKGINFNDNSDDRIRLGKHELYRIGRRRKGGRITIVIVVPSF